MLLEQVTGVLSRSGFTVSELCNVRPRCFDLTARREEILLLLKVLSNVDGISEDTARELRSLARFLCGSPLIIGEKARDQPLETGVAYQRYGIPAINLGTLYDFFYEGIPPLVYAAPGGLYVSIDGDMLKELRDRLQMSLGDLAKQLGVSRRTVSMYEDGMDATINVAMDLEDIFDAPLTQPVDLTGLEEEDDVRARARVPETDVMGRIARLGFNVFTTSHAPFDAVGRDEETTMLTGFSSYTKRMLKRAEIMSSISKVALTRSVYVVEGEIKSQSIGYTALIEKEELENVDGREELIELIDERYKDIRD